MKFDSKVKGGLAWAGLFVILAVPSADLLFGNDKAPAANLAVTSDTAQVKAPALVVPAQAELKTELKPELKADPIETASVPASAEKSDDPVDAYLSKGKKLPAYISDADAVPAVKAPVTGPAVEEAATVPAVKQATPAPVVTVKAPVDVAAVNPVLETPPIPLPRSARPVAKAPVVAAAPAEQPLIIDEATLGKPAAPVEPFPLSDGDQAFADDTIVTGDQLEEWDSGSLAEYLAAKGLLSEDRPRVREESDFVFNQGPSRPRRQSDFFLF